MDKTEDKILLSRLKFRLIRTFLFALAISIILMVMAAPFLAEKLEYERKRADIARMRLALHQAEIALKEQLQETEEVTLWFDPENGELVPEACPSAYGFGTSRDSRHYTPDDLKKMGVETYDANKDDRNSILRATIHLSSNEILLEWIPVEELQLFQDAQS